MAKTYLLKYKKFSEFKFRKKTFIRCVLFWIIGLISTHWAKDFAPIPTILCVVSTLNFIGWHIAIIIYDAQKFEYDLFKKYERKDN